MSVPVDFSFFPQKGTKKQQEDLQWISDCSMDGGGWALVVT